MCSCGGIRPIGWLLSLPFVLLSLIFSAIGVFIWTVGTSISAVFPCCMCLTVLLEYAIELIKVPLNVMEWFTSLVPC